MAKNANLTLPYPPSVNHYWGIRVVGRVPMFFVKADGKLYKKQVAQIGAMKQPFAENVCLKIVAYRPRKSGDVDNVLKAILDALKGVAYNDDSQVTEIWVKRKDDKENPRVEVSASPERQKSPKNMKLKPSPRRKKVGI